MITDKKEQELLSGFRRLCPADKNTVLTAVSMAVSAEDAVRRQFTTVPTCANCATPAAGGSVPVELRQGA